MKRRYSVRLHVTKDKILCTEHWKLLYAHNVIQPEQYDQNMHKKSQVVEKSLVNSYLFYLKQIRVICFYSMRQLVQFSETLQVYLILIIVRTGRQIWATSSVDYDHINSLHGDLLWTINGWSGLNHWKSGNGHTK